MYARGIKCLPVDLYKSDATRFLICDDGILPPFTALQAWSHAAKSIVEARKKWRRVYFIEDLKMKSGVSRLLLRSLTPRMPEGMAESSQLTLF